jgi:hypothetical protein
VFEAGFNRVLSAVDRAAVEQVCSKYFGFSCHSFLPAIAPQSPQFIVQGFYNRPINGRCNSGLGFTAAPYINRSKNEKKSEYKLLTKLITNSDQCGSLLEHILTAYEAHDDGPAGSTAVARTES